MPRMLHLSMLLVAASTLVGCAAIVPSPIETQIPAKPTAIAAATPRPIPTPRRTPRPLPALDQIARIERDVTYCTVDGAPQKMDLYYPLKTDGLPMPVAVNVHGGSWSAGDKRQSEGTQDFSELVARGYLVVAVNYRFAPAHKFPAQIEDVKCAIRHLRANAAKYNLDPKRIGAWGCSAGGHLVSLLGVTDPNAGYDKGEYLDQSSRIQAAVPMCAPSDITLYDITARADMLKRVFGVTTNTNPVLVKASPTIYISKDDPPFLIFQAAADSLIPLKQAEALYNRLKDAGVAVSLVIVQNAEHCFPPSDPPLAPTREEISVLIGDFFDTTLRK